MKKVSLLSFLLCMLPTVLSFYTSSSSSSSGYFTGSSGGYSTGASQGSSGQSGVQKRSRSAAAQKGSGAASMQRAAPAAAGNKKPANKGRPSGLHGIGGGQGMGGGSGIEGGQGSGEDGEDNAATSNIPKQQLLSLEQNKMLQTALTHNTAHEMPPDLARDFVGGDPKCMPSTVEGNWGALREDLKKTCIEKARNKKRNANRYAKKLISAASQPTDKCVRKLDTKSMLCQTRKVINDLVKKPYYQVILYGNNVVQLRKSGKVVMMAVNENIKYNVNNNSKNKKKPTMEKPTVILDFNRLGSLLKQRGELPKSKKKNPCTSCLEHLEKQESLEGQNENCGACSTFMELMTVRPNSFKDITKDRASKKKSGDDSDKNSKQSKDIHSSSDDGE